MKGWMPMPAAIGIATSARIVDAVIHGTKKWRTKAIAATTKTKPSDDGRHLRLHRIDQPGVDVEGREDGLEAQDHAAVHEEPEGPPGLQGALVETPYHEEAEEGPPASGGDAVEITRHGPDDEGDQDGGAPDLGRGERAEHGPLKAHGIQVHPSRAVGAKMRRIAV